MTECAACGDTGVVRRGRVSTELRVAGLGMLPSAEFRDVPCPACVCVLCEQPMASEPSTSVAQPMHRACALRSAVGGIGHLIAHEYWCLERDDPDAGLTYRQSALLVDEFVAVMGLEEAARRA